MSLLNPEFVGLAYGWATANFLILLLVFSVALYLNRDFNILMVGLIYLLPLVPVGLTEGNAHRFLIQSLQNTVFGTIELVIFVITVRAADAAFDREHFKQLFGHVLPIAAALMGLSFVSRLSTVPVTPAELILIMTVFMAGSVMRVLAVYQLGSLGFKFDIVFREEQKLQTEKLYGWIRHPSYTAMMIVILAYAITTHSLWVGVAGMGVAWFGFQYRIHHEEIALKKQFGEAYEGYRGRTGMWLPWRREAQGRG